MSCFVVYFLKAITYMYLTFTSKKQVSKGLLTGDQKRTFSLSKPKLRLRESERVSPNARSHLDSKFKTQSSIIETRDSILESFENRESSLESQSDCQLTFKRYCNRRTVINPVHTKKNFETTFGLVQTSYSLSKWKAVKLTFFAPCSLSVLLDAKGFVQYMHTE